MPLLFLLSKDNTRRARRWAVLTTAMLVFAGTLSAQSVEKYIQAVRSGEIDQARAALPGLLQRRPDDPAVRYLHGLLETDGDKAYQIFKGIADQTRYTPYRDDALIKVGEYLFAKGLYLSAEKYLQKIPMHYPRSPYMEQAANLLVNSLAAAGKTDSSRIMARVLQREYPKITITPGPQQLASTAGGSGNTAPETVVPPEPVDLSQDNPYYDADDSDVAPAPAPADTDAGGPVKYALQVGAFSSLDNANTGKEIFQDHDYPVRVLKRNRNGTQLFLVWIGDYDTRSQAERVGEDIRQKLALPFFIVETQEQ